MAIVLVPQNVNRCIINMKLALPIDDQFIPILVLVMVIGVNKLNIEPEHVVMFVGNHVNHSIFIIEVNSRYLAYTVLHSYVHLNLLLNVYKQALILVGHNKYFLFIRTTKELRLCFKWF